MRVFLYDFFFAGYIIATTTVVITHTVAIVVVLLSVGYAGNRRMSTKLLGYMNSLLLF